MHHHVVNQTIIGLTFPTLCDNVIREGTNKLISVIFSEYGAQNFQNIFSCVNKLAQTIIDLTNSEELQKRLTTLKDYLLFEFSSNLKCT